MKARVVNLAKTEAEWAKLKFIPLMGELVVYTPDDSHVYSRIKLGDGVHYLHELPFLVESIASRILNDYSRDGCADGGRITEYF